MVLIRTPEHIKSIPDKTAIHDVKVSKNVANIIMFIASYLENL